MIARYYLVLHLTDTISIPGQSDAEAKEELRSWTRQDASWRHREQASLPQIRSALRHHSSPRLSLWREFTRGLKHSKLGDEAKLQAVNLFVNEMITYDHHKHDRFPEGKDDRDWHQTSFTTLRTGKGECSDIARLKLTTLKAAGFDPARLRLVGGIGYGLKNEILGGHEILVADIGGTRYALNDNMTSGGTKLERGGIVPFDSYVKTLVGGSKTPSPNKGTFLPLVSEDGRSTLRIYQGANAGTAKPPAARSKYERLAMPVADKLELCEQGSCLTLDGPAAGETGLERLRHQLERAHDLNVTRGGQGRVTSDTGGAGRHSLKAMHAAGPTAAARIEAPAALPAFSAIRAAGRMARAPRFAPG